MDLNTRWTRSSRTTLRRMMLHGVDMEDVTLCLRISLLQVRFQTLDSMLLRNTLKAKRDGTWRTDTSQNLSRMRMKMNNSGHSSDLTMEERVDVMEARENIMKVWKIMREEVIMVKEETISMTKKRMRSKDVIEKEVMGKETMEEKVIDLARP